MGAAPHAGYARALEPRALRFPADHGAHPDFRSEWWYLTGNLADPDGRRFGFQLTLFRFALAPRESERRSGLATRQAWMGHFAVTDVAGERFHAFERFARGAAGLAGARASPFRVWLEDWSISGLDPQALLPLRVRASQDGVALDLTLAPGRGPVLQGDRGLSRKSAEPGNASYYYSYTRLPASGRVQTPEGRFQVQGAAWLDREWSTSALAPDQSGWDWFALQLDGGTDIMFYRLRGPGGSMHPFSAGVVVGDEGPATRLRASDVTLVPRRRWRSPRGGEYPVAWRLRTAELDLEVSALLDAQEHGGAFRYWEGAVAVSGHDGQGPVSGHGYLEMTGY
jgi:predicted secreted hydrolase